MSLIGIVQTQRHMSFAVQRACMMRDRSLRLEYLCMPQGALQRGPHLRVLELIDGQAAVGAVALIFLAYCQFALLLYAVECSERLVSPPT
jgi:hypothetical protein